jgi:hypothetical protein
MLEQMGAIVDRIGSTQKVAILQHPESMATVSELAKLAVNGLEISRRILVSRDDTQTAILLLGGVNAALETIVSISQNEVAA